MDASDMPRRAPARLGWTPPLALFGLALALRLLYLLSLRGEPFLAAPLVDARVFWLAAQQLVTGVGAEPIYLKPPLLTWLLALVQQAGGGFVAARVLLAVIASSAAPLAAWLAFPLLNRRGACLAGLLTALYAPGIFLAPEAVPAGLVLVLSLASLVALDRAEASAGGRWAAGAGLLLGLAALARPTALLFGALVLLRYARRPRRLGLVAAGLVVALAPALVHNLRGGALVPVSANGGLNFYLGNHAGADGRSAQAPELPPDAVAAPLAAKRLAEEAAGRSLNAAQVDRYWFGRGVHWLERSPADALALAGRKLYYALNDRELSDVLNYRALRELSPVLGFNPLGFGLLLALALPGLRLLWRAPTGRLVLLYGLSTLLPLVLFFVTGRFRLPLLPVLTLAASAWLLALVDTPRRRWRHRWPEFLLVAAAALFSFSRAWGVDEDRRWHFHQHQGYLRFAAGDLPGALADYERALESGPAVADLHNAVAYLEATLGLRLDEAEAHALEALRLTPETSPARAGQLDTLGWVLLKRGRLDQAAGALEEALALLPPDPAARAEATTHLGLVRRAQGREGEALVLLRAAAPYSAEAAAALAP